MKVSTSICSKQPQSSSNWKRKHQSKNLQIESIIISKKPISMRYLNYSNEIYSVSRYAWMGQNREVVSIKLNSSRDIKFFGIFRVLLGRLSWSRWTAVHSAIRSLDYWALRKPSMKRSSTITCLIMNLPSSRCHSRSPTPKLKITFKPDYIWAR